MTKAPFVFEHTTKNSPLEGVTITAGAQAAVRQPSTPASGRGEALEGGDSCAIPPPFQRREVGVRTSHTTAAERLSSIGIIGSYELPAASYRDPFPTRRPPNPGTLIRGPSSTLPSGETYWTWMTTGSPAGIIRVSSRAKRFKRVLLPIHPL